MTPELEKILFVPNQIPSWVERHKDKFNKLVYKSLKQQNRLYEVAMQKMLFGSLAKELQEQIIKEAKRELKRQKGEDVPEEKEKEASSGLVLFVEGEVPFWVEKYKKFLNTMVYKSLKSQGRLKSKEMQKMLFGTLPQDVQEKIQKEVEEAKKRAKASAVPASSPSSAKMEALLEKISEQLDVIIQLLKEKR